MCSHETAAKICWQVIARFRLNLKSLWGNEVTKVEVTKEDGLARTRMTMTKCSDNWAKKKPALSQQMFLWNSLKGGLLSKYKCIVHVKDHTDYSPILDLLSKYGWVWEASSNTRKCSFLNVNKLVKKIWLRFVYFKPACLYLGVVYMSRAQVTWKAGQPGSSRDEISQI